MRPLFYIMNGLISMKEIMFLKLIKMMKLRRTNIISGFNSQYKRCDN